MLDRTILWSLENRLLILVAAVSLMLYGGYVSVQMPVDVFPDLTAPTVTILTECHGYAPEEVESLVTLPIERAMNGASNVFRVRSNSAIGISIVFVEFSLDTDIYRARQLVNEKLQLVELPESVSRPTLGPISSTMGEIMLISVTGETTTQMELRTLTDWTLRPRLLGVQGVSQVMVIGGEMKQFQVLVDPQKLIDFDLELEEVVQAVTRASATASGGFLSTPHTEYLIRGQARARQTESLAAAVVAVRDRVPILLREVAKVKIGASLKRGDGSFNGRPCVVATIQKQPNANTLELTQEIESTLAELQRTLPADVKINTQAFQQADFIKRAIANVRGSIIEGSVMVLIVLFLFLWNFRTTLISLTAIPLSLVTAVLALDYLGTTMNTMTLGGMAIAIGALVDDAIIDVENVFRRLRENARKAEPKPALEVIFRASSEVRYSILFATLIIIVVFLPLFALQGFEGRMFAPLAFAYVIAIAASLLVAMTVTPVLCYFLLADSALIEEEQESVVVRWLKARYEKILEWVLNYTAVVFTLATAALLCAVAVFPFMGREFLPPFNEGTLNINANLPPGTSLAESNRTGALMERILLEIPEVVSTTRRTGRAELDEHANDVSTSEIEVVTEPKDRSHDEFMGEVRERMGQIPGLAVEVGQPISHRIDHMMSGTRAQIAIKLFGPDLFVLRAKAQEIKTQMESVEGVVDLLVEQQVAVPQVQIAFDRQAGAAVGLTAEGFAEAVDTSFQGHVAAQILEEHRTFDVLVRFEESARGNMEALRRAPIDTPLGFKVPLAQVAQVREGRGPNTLNRENVQRRIIIQANVAGRDLGSVIDEIRRNIGQNVELPQGYYVQYGGQFEAQEKATRLISGLSLVSIGAIFLLLYVALGTARAAGLVMSNLPLALIGGVLMVFAAGGTLSIASLVGFITLFGIATRNGIMLVTHYQYLAAEEGRNHREAVIQGSLERLSPILMTALVTGVGLIPLALGVGEPGKEIQQPMAMVILGGIFTSTLLNMVVVPGLYWRFGQEKSER